MFLRILVGFVLLMACCAAAMESVRVSADGYGFELADSHKPFIPISYLAAAEQEQGVRDYPYVDFIAHRSEKKFASFSWKNRIMGLLIPIGEGHEENPDFTSPIPNGLVGSFDLPPRGNVTMKVVEHSRMPRADGFETTGTVLINGGGLKQELRMLSIGSHTVVYEDRVTAVSDVTVKAELGVPIGIENDQITGGTRIITSQSGQTQFDFHHPQQSVALTGPWANVDGRLAIVMPVGSGLSYKQASGYSPGISVCSDILYGSFSQKERQFKGGDLVAHRVAVLYVEVTPQETAALAKSCSIESAPAGQVLHLTQPGCKVSDVPLLKE